MSTPPKRRPTLDEVAQTAGVSRAAASRAINSSGNVSPATRQAVERAVRELDYVPNRSARALATQQAGAVVLAVSHHDPELFADPFFAQVIVGVSAELERTDLVLMLVLAASEHGRSRLERILRSRRADGLMLLSLHGDDPLHRLAGKLDLPVVYGGRPLDAEPQWYVDADNRGGARLAAEHLIALGRRRIATVTGLLDTDAAVQRLRGYREALAVAGLDTTRTVEADFTEAGGYTATRHLLDRHPDLDAVFAASDNMAAGALRALRESGRRVPEDVAVVGFDDAPVSRLTTPQLSTVQQPIRQLGREMARMLVTLIEGEEPTPLILPTKLLVRGSSLPAHAPTRTLDATDVPQA